MKKVMAEMGQPAGITRDGLEQRAIRLVASRHPRIYRQYLKAEMAKEDIIPLKRGSEPTFPHGTRQAVERHRRHSETMCDVCAAFDAERFGRGKCFVCEQEFIRSSRKNTLCDADCRFLWSGYVRYHVKWVVCRLYHARSVVKNPTAHADPQVRSARRLLKEYAETGTVLRKRTLNHYPAKAMEIAERKGIDIDAVVDRLEMEAA